MPHDNPGTLVFWCQRSWRNSNGVTPYKSDKYRNSGLQEICYVRGTARRDCQYRLESRTYRVALFAWSYV